MWWARSPDPREIPAFSEWVIQDDARAGLVGENSAVRQQSPRSEKRQGTGGDRSAWVDPDRSPGPSAFDRWSPFVHSLNAFSRPPTPGPISLYGFSADPSLCSSIFVRWIPADEESHSSILKPPWSEPYFESIRRLVEKRGFPHERKTPATGRVRNALIVHFDSDVIGTSEFIWCVLSEVYAVSSQRDVKAFLLFTD